MPLYEYECDACGHRFERIQKFSDPLANACPKCGGPVHKLMSSPAIQFKGSGFYITDYPKKDHAAAQKADSEKGDKSGTGEKVEKSDKGGSASDAGAKSETAPAKTDSSTTTASAPKDTKSTKIS
jgi:putative FmdB family regulatory protein